MGWCTTSDHDRFAAAAGGYLRSRAAENSTLLSAATAARSGRRPQVVGQPSGPRPAGDDPGGGGERAHPLIILTCSRACAGRPALPARLIR